MKRLLFLLLAAITLAGVSCRAEEKSAIVHLDRQAFISKVIDIDQATEWKYKGDKPCIIDFYADWCGPCRMLTPTLEGIAKDYAGKLYVYKINVDEEKELAAFFGAQSIPLLIYIPMNGNPTKTVGLLPREDVEKVVKEFLLK